MLVLGFLLGHFTTARADTTKLRAVIEPELRQQLRQEMTQLLQKIDSSP